MPSSGRSSPYLSTRLCRRARRHCDPTSGHGPSQAHRITGAQHSGAVAEGLRTERRAPWLRQAGVAGWRGAGLWQHYSDGASPPTDRRPCHSGASRRQEQGRHRWGRDACRLASPQRRGRGERSGGCSTASQRVRSGACRRLHSSARSWQPFATLHNDASPNRPCRETGAGTPPAS